MHQVKHISVSGDQSIWSNQGRTFTFNNILKLKLRFLIDLQEET